VANNSFSQAKPKKKTTLKDVLTAIFVVAPICFLIGWAFINNALQGIDEKSSLRLNEVGSGVYGFGMLFIASLGLIAIIIGCIVIIGSIIDFKKKDVGDLPLTGKDYSSKGCFGNYYNYCDKGRECSLCSRSSLCKTSSSCFGMFYVYRDKGCCTNCSQKSACRDANK